MFHAIGWPEVVVDLGEWGGGEMRRIIFAYAPRLLPSVMYTVYHAVASEKKLSTLHSLSRFDQIEEAWLCGEGLLLNTMVATL